MVEARGPSIENVAWDGSFHGMPFLLCVSYMFLKGFSFLLIIEWE